MDRPVRYIARIARRLRIQENPERRFLCVSPEQFDGASPELSARYDTPILHFAIPRVELPQNPVADPEPLPFPEYHRL